MVPILGFLFLFVYGIFFDWRHSLVIVMGGSVLQGTIRVIMSLIDKNWSKFSIALISIFVFYLYALLAGVFQYGLGKPPFVRIQIEAEGHQTRSGYLITHADGYWITISEDGKEVQVVPDDYAKTVTISPRKVIPQP